MDQFLTIAQVCKITQLGERTVRRYIAEQKLPAFRCGRAIRIKKNDVDKLFTPTTSWMT